MFWILYPQKQMIQEKDVGESETHLCPWKTNSVNLEDKLLQIADEEGLKTMFETSVSLAAYWIQVRSEYWKWNIILSSICL